MNAKKIKFIDIVKMIVRTDWAIELVMLLITVVMLVFTKDVFVSFYFPILFILGIVLSVSIHEYLHILCMKKNGIYEIKIKNDLWKFSVKTDEELYGSDLIITALSGPVVCFVIGVALSIIGSLFEIRFCLVCSVFYLIHIINIIPPLGDGKMIMKGILTLNTYER